MVICISGVPLMPSTRSWPAGTVTEISRAPPDGTRSDRLVAVPGLAVRFSIVTWERLWIAAAYQSWR